MRILLGRNHAMADRAAVAFAPTFTPTNTAEIGLFNNSSGPHVIIVWDASETFDSSTNPAGYLLKRAPLATLIGSGQSVIAGEPAPIGQIYKGDLASPDLIQVSYVCGEVPNNNHSPIPLAVLLPGWSCVFVGEAATQALGLTFWYQWLYAEEWGYNARNPLYDSE